MRARRTGGLADVNDRKNPAAQRAGPAGSALALMMGDNHRGEYFDISRMIVLLRGGDGNDFSSIIEMIRITLLDRSTTCDPPREFCRCSRARCRAGDREGEVKDR